MAAVQLRNKASIESDFTVSLVLPLVELARVYAVV